jgi:hypothetical protein
MSGFDSHTLRLRWYTELVSENRNPNTQCSICKKPIYKRPSQIAINNGKVYCGPTCYGIACRREKPCIVCGKLMLARLNKKTCSRGCSNRLRTGIQYKQNQPRSKVKSYKLLKIRLVKLRGPVCQRCGYSKVEILQVHHKNRDHTNNELENLELICPNCHFEEHYLEKSWFKKLIH